MTNIKVQEEIEIIQRMMESTRKKAMDSGNIFILWGTLVLTAAVIAKIFAWLHLSAISHYVILLFPVGGVAMTLHLKKKRERKTRVVFFVDKIIAATWFATGLSIAVSSAVFLISPLLTSLQNIYVSIIILFIGTGITISGAAYQWKALKIVGLLWCASAVAVQFIPPSYFAITIIFIFGLGLIIPGLLANYQLRKSEK